MSKPFPPFLDLYNDPETKSKHRAIAALALLAARKMPFPTLGSIADMVDADRSTLAKDDDFLAVYDRYRSLSGFKPRPSNRGEEPKNAGWAYNPEGDDDA